MRVVLVINNHAILLVKSRRGPTGLIVTLSVAVDHRIAGGKFYQDPLETVRLVLYWMNLVPATLNNAILHVECLTGLAGPHVVSSVVGEVSLAGEKLFPRQPATFSHARC